MLHSQLSRSLSIKKSSNVMKFMRDFLGIIIAPELIFSISIWIFTTIVGFFRLSFVDCVPLAAPHVHDINRRELSKAQV